MIVGPDEDLRVGTEWAVTVPLEDRLVTLWYLSEPHPLMGERWATDDVELDVEVRQALGTAVDDVAGEFRPSAEDGASMWRLLRVLCPAGRMVHKGPRRPPFPIRPTIPEGTKR